MSDEEFERRKSLSFLQAQGIEPLPRMLSGAEVTPQFRANAYGLIIVNIGFVYSGHRHGRIPSNATVLVWKDYFGLYPDSISSELGFKEFVKKKISSGPHLLDLLQFLCRKKILSKDDFNEIQRLLATELIGFRFVGSYDDGDVTLLPIVDEAEADANQSDYAELQNHPNARKHFLQAVEHLKGAHYRGSVTESICGVESTIKSLSGKSTVTFGEGLKRLDKSNPLHSTLKAGLEKIYGWTNSPSGMRHAMSDEAQEVTEAEARFMLSACLAFAAWLKRSHTEG
ncbi:MAG: hypothetical protein ACK4M6_09995 [Hyphomonas sp.]